jgi:hypothetical protein
MALCVGAARKQAGGLTAGSCAILAMVDDEPRDRYET